MAVSSSEDVGRPVDGLPSPAKPTQMTRTMLTRARRRMAIGTAIIQTTMRRERFGLGAGGGDCIGLLSAQRDVSTYRPLKDENAV